MAKQHQKPDAGAERQRPLEAAKQEAEHSAARGAQPNQIAEKANMKRQQKKMHEQDRK